MISPKLRHVLVSPVYWTFFFIGGGTLFLFISHFTNAELIRNNLGISTLWLEYGVSATTVLLGSVFFWLSSYKFWYFSSGFHGKKSSIFGSFWSVLSVIVSGCPACSITAASYIGLSSFLAGLPFMGYEIRMLWLLIMLGAVVHIWRNLETCAIPKKPKLR